MCGAGPQLTHCRGLQHGLNHQGRQADTEGYRDLWQGRCQHQITALSRTMGPSGATYKDRGSLQLLSRDLNPCLCREVPDVFLGQQLWHLVTSLLGFPPPQLALTSCNQAPCFLSHSLAQLENIWPCPQPWHLASLPPMKGAPVVPDLLSGPALGLCPLASSSHLENRSDRWG